MHTFKSQKTIRKNCNINPNFWVKLNLYLYILLYIIFFRSLQSVNYNFKILLFSSYKSQFVLAVGGEVDADTSLNDYLRNVLNLRGTKFMCKEGGCGACIVAVTAIQQGVKRTFSVNSVRNIFTTRIVNISLHFCTKCQDVEHLTASLFPHRYLSVFQSKENRVLLTR